MKLNLKWNWNTKWNSCSRKLGLYNELNCFTLQMLVHCVNTAFHNPWRRMPGHIREFNRLKPHSSHDLVFKIWPDNKTDLTFRVFCLWLWVTRNLISMGTTGILISKNIKFEILPSINASLSDFTGFFALKTNQKIAIFVWIFTCVDFRRKIATKVCRNRERYHLISWHLSSAFKTTTVF